MAENTPWWANYVPAGVATGTALASGLSPLVSRLGGAAASAGRYLGGKAAGLGASIASPFGAAGAIANGAAGTYNAMNQINSDPSMVNNNLMMDPEMGLMSVPSNAAPPYFSRGGPAFTEPSVPPYFSAGGPAAGNGPPPALKDMLNAAGISMPSYPVQPTISAAAPGVPASPMSQMAPRIPMPMANPLRASAAAPAAPQSYYNGPGSSSFGAGDQPPGLYPGDNSQQTSGPDLIKKFMGFLHQQGPTGSEPGKSGFASGYGGGSWAPDGGFSLFG